MGYFNNIYSTSTRTLFMKDVNMSLTFTLLVKCLRGSGPTIDSEIVCVYTNKTTNSVLFNGVT